ncbi:hypothetical protein [Alkalicoccus chagannorensis]|uniref:hypothetical protein n=1 Tax=Alkalicoccus chagannorensis TaxID=427072 RepID=UPI0004249B0D|nr:hypothetical protein [Alkalicoccus chagannorensis]
MTAMNWRDRLLEQAWLQPLLPNYMKPLDEPSLMNENMREFIYEAEEFISDLAALAELPRMNKTFKRSIQGFTYKVKMKPKKLLVEMIDTHKSASTMKKRVFITVHRSHHKSENGSGKVADSTIYYQKSGRTYVRSVRRHESFQTLFYHLHRLDMSLSGQTTELLPPGQEAKPAAIESTSTMPAQEPLMMQQSLQELRRETKGLTESMTEHLSLLEEELQQATEEYHLFAVEERYELKRMMLHDIPDLIRTFSSLSDTQRQESAPRVENSLARMLTHLRSYTEDLEKTRMDRMNHVLQVQQLRYEQEDHQHTKTSTLMRRHQKQLDEQ